MELSNPARLAKLVRHLAMTPSEIPSYVWHNFIVRQSPLELGLPWMSYRAIAFLRKYAQPGMKVFEYGSGGSTVFFARRGCVVRSTEDDPQWYRGVSQKIAPMGFADVSICLHEFDFSTEENFRASPYLAEISREAPHDIIVVDGQDWSYRIRPICFAEAEKHLSAGGIIVVDDSWRYEQLRTRNGARRCAVMAGTGPARFGVTSTDVYFY